MENVFAKERKHSEFAWANLGDIKRGRQELGEEMPVLVYRLMQYTMLDVMSKDMGEDKANEYFRAAGLLAGKEYAENTLDMELPFEQFIQTLQKSLKDLKIGILRMEAFDVESGEIVLTVGEDLDCSGLPVTHENVCVYDEGFLAGILEKYTGKKYHVREIDCWANGNRACRFKGVVEK